MALRQMLNLIVFASLALVQIAAGASGNLNSGDGEPHLSWQDSYDNSTSLFKSRGIAFPTSSLVAGSSSNAQITTSATSLSTIPSGDNQDLTDFVSHSTRSTSRLSSREISKSPSASLRITSQSAIISNQNLSSSTSSPISLPTAASGRPFLTQGSSQSISGDIWQGLKKSGSNRDTNSAIAKSPVKNIAEENAVDENFADDDLADESIALQQHMTSRLTSSATLSSSVSSPTVTPNDQEANVTYNGGTSPSKNSLAVSKSYAQSRPGPTNSTTLLSSNATSIADLPNTPYSIKTGAHSNHSTIFATSNTVSTPTIKNPTWSSLHHQSRPSLYHASSLTIANTTLNSTIDPFDLLDVTNSSESESTLLDDSNSISSNHSKAHKIYVEPDYQPSYPIFSTLRIISTGNCTGTITKTQGVETTTVTSTVYINEIVSVAPNATIPPPTFITPAPIPACITLSRECIGMCGGLNPLKNPKPQQPSATSTLLVTKKSPAVLGQGQAVGNIFGSPSTTTQTPEAQQTGSGKQADVPSLQNAAPSGQGSGSSGTDSQPQAPNSEASPSTNSEQSSAGSAAPQQQAQVGDVSAVPSTAANTNSQLNAGGQSGNAASKQEAVPPSAPYTGPQLVTSGQSFGNSAPPQDDQGSNTSSTPSGAGNEGPSTSSSDQASGNVVSEQGVHNPETPSVPSAAAGSNPQLTNPNIGGGQTAEEEEGTAGSGVSASSEDSSGQPKSSESSSNNAQVNEPSGYHDQSLQSPSSHFLPGQDSSHDSDNEQGGTSSSVQGTSPGVGQANSGSATNYEDSSDEQDGSLPGSYGGSNLGKEQYAPSAVTLGNIPVSIASDAVIVGSHTIDSGAFPTTIIVNSQAIAIRPSQIVAPGTTVPIHAVITPEPASSETVNGVPIALRSGDVVIGSETFHHGSSPTSVIYNGQTYAWDASQLSAPGTVMAFPSADNLAPRVTAGGQTFSVYPSLLKVSGTTIPLPATPSASPFVYNGRTFSVNPSQLIVPDTNIPLPSPAKATPFTYNSHSFTIEASHLIAPSATIPLVSGSGVVTFDGQKLSIGALEIVGLSSTIPILNQIQAYDTAQLSAITTGGLTLSLGPAAAVIGSSTYSFSPGEASSVITNAGQAITLGPQGVKLGSIDLPVPSVTHDFSAVTEGHLVFSVAPSAVVIGDHTDGISSDMTPITTVVDGQTISIGPQGVGLASVTIPLPTAKPSFSVFKDGGLTFSIAPTAAVIDGNTIPIGPNNAPVTMMVDGRKVSVGLDGINLQGTTVDFPILHASQTPLAVTADGITFSVGASAAVVQGTTYAIGSGASSKTVLMGSEPVIFGSSGVVLPSTTIAPEQTPTAMTAEGLTFSADSTQAAINGTTYAIGSGAPAQTLVAGSETIRLGPNGIMLPSTTIHPGIDTSGSPSSLAFETSSAPPTPVPITTSPPSSPEITGKKKAGAESGAGPSAQVPGEEVIMGIILGGVLLCCVVLW